MTVLYVLAVLLLVLFLASFVRVGAWVEFSEGGLVAKLRVGAFYIQLFPMKPKAKKEKRPRAPNKKPEQPADKPKGGPLDLAKKYMPLVKELLPVVADAAGQTKRRIRIDDFRLDLIWRAADPAACAMGFGRANAAIGMIWPLVAQNFNVKNHCIRTGVDFEQGKPTVYLLAMATLTIGQGVSLAVRVAIRSIRAFLRARPQKDKTKQTQTQQKEAV